MSLSLSISGFPTSCGRVSAGCGAVSCSLLLPSAPTPSACLNNQSHTDHPVCLSTQVVMRSTHKAPGLEVLQSKVEFSAGQVRNGALGWPQPN